MGGYFLSLNQIRLPLFATQALLVLPFIFVGHIYYQYKDRLNARILFLASLSLYLLSIYVFESNTNLAFNRVPNNILGYLLGGFSGSIAIVSLSKILADYATSQSVQYLHQCGIYSFTIMALHNFIRPWSDPLRAWIGNDWIYCFTDTIILMVISLPLGIWIMKKCPTIFSYR